MMRTLIALFRKDLLLEIRQQYTFYGILLYGASTVFVVFLAMGEPTPETWNGLFWVVQLFVCVNAVAKSFLQEGRGRMLYFYSIAGSRQFILAKLFFNVLVMICLSVVTFFLFRILLGNPLADDLTFIAVAAFGGLGLSLVFTFLSAIAARAGHQAPLMAVLGFPLIIPELLLLMRLSNIAFDRFQGGLSLIILLLACLDVFVIVLAVILFPFLWKD